MGALENIGQAFDPALIAGPLMPKSGGDDELDDLVFGMLDTPGMEFENNDYLY